MSGEDTEAPIISITYPEEITYREVVNFLEFNIVEDFPDSCWYSNDSGSTNTFFNCGQQLLVLESVLGQNIWTIYANDTSGNSASESVTFKYIYEVCTDGKDNDEDGIIDDLDKDCAAENGKTVKITNLISDPEIFTYRTMDIDCDYETESEYNVQPCIKLNVSGIKCNPLTIVDNVVRFRGCKVGDEEKEDAEVTCYVNSECNSESPAQETNLFDITRFSICNYDDVGEENLKLRLFDPAENSNFDTPEDIDFELEVENRNPDYAFDVIVEAWLYDVNNEIEILISRSDSMEIIRSRVSEDNFVLNLTVPQDVVSGTHYRLYYKAYVENEEKNICISDSVRLYLNNEECIDDDGDDYCEENDCDDTNSSINPGEFELCTDNIDNDCDDLIDSDDLECEPEPGNEIPAGQSEDLGVLTRSGKQRIMNFDSRADFKIQVAGEQHSATIKNVTSNSITLTISSNPFDIVLTVGQTKAVDVDDDSIDDLAVTLNGIENGKADMTFRNIFVAARGDDDTIELGDEEEKGRGIGWFIFIFVL
ncbi:MAG: MopE-related protein, partial [Patescibacteria group bacterium]|nr:MopE-related protein [Patescibacteria group bacterium]